MQATSSLLHVTKETMHLLATVTITEWAVIIMRFPIFSAIPSFPLVNKFSMERQLIPYIFGFSTPVQEVKPSILCYGIVLLLSWEKPETQMMRLNTPEDTITQPTQNQ